MDTFDYKFIHEATDEETDKGEVYDDIINKMLNAKATGVCDSRGAYDAQTLEIGTRAYGPSDKESGGVALYGAEELSFKAKKVAKEYLYKKRAEFIENTPNEQCFSSASSYTSDGSGNPIKFTVDTRNSAPPPIVEKKILSPPIN